MNIQEAINNMFMGKCVMNKEIENNVHCYKIKNCKLYGVNFTEYAEEFEIELSLEEIISNCYEIVEYHEIYEKFLSSRVER